MSRGGYKPGAGRPRKSAPPVQIAAEQENLTPLEYMLKYMNDPAVDAGRRDRLAIAAAPFVHQRVADNRVGKKELEAEAANAATQSEEWGDDLRVATSQQH